MKIKMANRIALDGTPRFAASHLGLFCLPRCPIKRTSGLYGLKTIFGDQYNVYLISLKIVFSLQFFTIIGSYNWCSKVT